MEEKCSIPNCDEEAVTMRDGSFLCEKHRSFEGVIKYSKRIKRPKKER